MLMAMATQGSRRIRAAEVVLPCGDLEGTIDFCVERLGFAILSIAPADAPRVAVITGRGLRLRLERSGRGEPGLCRLGSEDGRLEELVAPNGTRIELVPEDPEVCVVPSGEPVTSLAASRDCELLNVGMQNATPPNRKGT